MRGLAALAFWCLVTVPACNTQADPTAAEGGWVGLYRIDVPTRSLTYVRPAALGVVGGMAVRIGRADSNNPPAPLLECNLAGDGTRFECDRPFTLRANTDYWIYVVDPARPLAKAPLCTSSVPTYPWADGISLLGQDVGRRTELFILSCNWTAARFRVSPSGSVH